MDLKQWLRFEKEIFFIKYLFKQPFRLIKNSFIDTNFLLSLETILFIIALFRGAFFNAIKNFPIVWDNYTTSVMLFIILTAIYISYKNQHFQEEYQKEKEERLKDVEDY